MTRHIYKITRKLKRSNLKRCSECGDIIDNVRIKGMLCMKCDKLICFKCNKGFKCSDCYNETRNEYYTNKKVE